MGLIPRSAIIDAAEALNLGLKRSQLEDLFTKSRKLSLVGSYAKKESRRGGEGLWYPVHGELFQAVVRNRAAGVPFWKLANLPLGGWLLAAEGIELDQARRAMDLWASYIVGEGTERPTGARSSRSRAIASEAARLSSPDAKVSDRRKLKQILELLVDTMPVDSVSPETFDAVFMRAAFAGREPTPSMVRVADAALAILRFTFTALEHWKTLRLDRPDVDRLWNWARQAHARTAVLYIRAQPALGSAPELGRLFEPLTETSIVRDACASLLTIFGVGLSQGPQSGLAPEFGRIPTIEL